MTRVVICHYCGYEIPARRFQQYCPICDERTLGSEALPDYRPLRVADYAAPAPPPVGLRDPAEAADDEPDAEGEAMMLETLLALRPWYLRTEFIVLLLLCLTPLGIVLMWGQRPRVGLLGGAFVRALTTLLFGGAWLALATVVLSSPELPRTVARLAGQGIERLANPDTARQAGGPLVTREKFNRLKPGDSRGDVTASLGRESRRISQVRVGGEGGLAPPLEMEALEWRNPDGSVVELTFENGRLTKKVEYGLP